MPRSSSKTKSEINQMADDIVAMDVPATPHLLEKVQNDRALKDAVVRKELVNAKAQADADNEATEGKATQSKIISK